MKCGALSIILLFAAVCWASDSEEVNQDDVNDSWSILREDSIGRRLSLDDAEKDEIDQLKQDKTAGAEDKSDDNSESANEEEQNDSIHALESFEDKEVQNKAEESDTDEEQNDSIDAEESVQDKKVQNKAVDEDETAKEGTPLQDDNVPNEATDEDEDKPFKENAALQDNNIPNESTEFQDSAEDKEMDIQSDSNGECGGVLRGTYGRFSSPGYPFGYPNNTRCQWRIRMRQRGHITITFRAFDVGKPSFLLCRNNYVEIRGAAFRTKRFCGRRKRFSVVIRGPWASVTFQSDRRRGGRGFSAVYSYSRLPPFTRPPFHTGPRPTRPSGDLARTLLQVIRATRMQLQAVEKLVKIRSKNSRDNYKRGFSDSIRVKVNDAVNKLENRVDIFKHGSSTDAEKSAVDDEMADLKSRAKFILNKLDSK